MDTPLRDIMLLCAAPEVAPGNFFDVGFHATSLTMIWDPIPCLQQNSEIVDYNVYVFNISESEFETINGVLFNGSSGGNTNYTATGLTPDTFYGFQVFSVTSENIQGIGSQLLLVHTAREWTPIKLWEGGGMGR
jgi:hypothetical protein